MKKLNKTLDPSLLSAYYDSELSPEKVTQVEELLNLNPELSNYFQDLDRLGEGVRDWSKESFELVFSEYKNGDIWSSIEGRLDFEDSFGAQSSVSDDSFSDDSTITPELVEQGFFGNLFNSKMIPTSLAFASVAALAVWFSGVNFGVQTNQEIIEVAKEDAIKGIALPKISRNETEQLALSNNRGENVITSSSSNSSAAKLEVGNLSGGQVDFSEFRPNENNVNSFPSVSSDNLLVSNKPSRGVLTLADGTISRANIPTAEIDWLRTSRNYNARVLVDGKGNVAPVIWLRKR